MVNQKSPGECRVLHTCSLRVCVSVKELLLGMITQGSKLHLEAPPLAPADSMQTRGRAKPPAPGRADSLVSKRQSRHITVKLTGACRGLLAAVMMPGIITSCETWSDCTHIVIVTSLHANDSSVLALWWLVTSRGYQKWSDYKPRTLSSALNMLTG